jgi:long-chain acyl-CoA synthetase
MVDSPRATSLGLSSMTLAVMIEESYWRYAPRPAIIHRGQRTTFAELGKRVHRLASVFLSFGLVPGDRVIIFLDNSPEFLETEQALFTSGLVRVALNTRLSSREVVQIANDCEARLIVTDATNASELSTLRTEMPSVTVVVAVGSTAGDGVVPYKVVAESGPSMRPNVPMPKSDAVAALMYTSGTTGTPKGATITHHNWVSMIRNLMAELPTIYDTDLVLHAAPMSHLSGSIGTAYSAKGAAQTFLERFDPHGVLKMIEESRVTVVPSVPTMLNALTSAYESEGFDLSSLCAIPYGGSAIAPQSLARAFDIFGEVLVQV